MIRLALGTQYGRNVMRVHEFEKLVRTDNSAKRYLSDICKKTGKLCCPACNGYKLYNIENNKRMRCAGCRYTFHLLTGRWLNKIKISARDWLWIVKLFELEIAATVIAKETGISYPTVLKAVDTIRMSIALTNGNAAIIDRDDEDLTTKTVFGILDDANGITCMEPLPDNVINLKLQINGSYLFFMEKSIKYTSLLFDNKEIRIVDLGRNFPKYRVYCNCGGFWPFAKERLLKYHGVSYNKLPLYLEEIIFRWTTGNEYVFNHLIEMLCRFIPDQHISINGSRIAV